MSNRFPTSTRQRIAIVVAGLVLLFVGVVVTLETNNVLVLAIVAVLVIIVNAWRMLSAKDGRRGE
jgi:hypothetical protein